MKTIDLHCDTLSVMLRQKDNGEHYNLYRRTGHLDIEKMQAGDYKLQCFAAFVDLEKEKNAFEQGRRLARLYKELCAEYSPYIAPVHSFRDIGHNADRGLISAMLTIEEGGVLEGKTENLRLFYEMGVRMITLTWNYPNEIGYPGALEKQPVSDGTGHKVTGAYPGLTKKGIEIVQEMDERGIIVDVSHLSDAGFWDVAAITRKPFAASHSNARTICGHKRNLTDEQIRMIGERGGVIGLNFCGEFLEDDPSMVTMDSFIRHVKHIIRMGGEEVLALGSDFDGFGLNPVLPDASALPRLFEAMEQAGIAPSVIDKIRGGNAYRLMREVIR